MARSVMTPRPAMTSRELDLCVARGKDARSDGLRQIAGWLRSRLSQHPVQRPSHKGAPSTA